MFGITFTTIIVGWLAVFFLSLVFVQTQSSTRLDQSEFFQVPRLNEFSYPLQTAKSQNLKVADTKVSPLPTLPLRASIPPKVYAYVPTWPRQSIKSLQENISSINVVLPEWYTIDWQNFSVNSIEQSHQAEVSAYLEAHAKDKTVLPVITGFDFDFQLRSKKEFDYIVDALDRVSDDPKVDGICLDYQWVTKESVPDLLKLLAAASADLAMKGKERCLILRLKTTNWPLADLVELVDEIIFTDFDQPGSGSPPEPISPHPSFTELSAQVLSQVGPSKAVFALGNVGYDWVSGEAIPRKISFNEIARLSGLHNAPISFDQNSLNSSLAYSDNRGQRHKIWFTDAVTAHNKLKVIASDSAKGVAMWNLGGEDPSGWKLLDEDTYDINVTQLLRNVSMPNYVGYEGQGDFLTAFGSSKPGVRELEVHPETGLIISQTYTQIPTAITIARWGNSGRNNITLTFDDGPDELITPQILDILKMYDVPATFFMVGENALINPEIVQRVIDEGHLIGVHTFTHPNINRVSNLRLLMEANSTQRLLAAITSKNTVLFRAPYGEDSEPQNSSEARSIVQLSAAGYITVGIPIDPRDWEENGADSIVKIAVEEALLGQGNTVLLHDSGGDRSQTVDTLPLLIETLRSAGFTFVSLDTLMSDVPVEFMFDSDERLNKFDAISFTLLAKFIDILAVLFAIAIILGISRSIIIVFFAYIRRQPKWPNDTYKPDVTAVVPAYCEEPVILRTIEALLDSDYINLKVIVVDDGSKDNTYKVVSNKYGKNPQIQLIRQKNQGKAQALNHGIRLADSEIIVAIDADTIILPDAISRLVQHFNNPNVGAVAGNTKVGNRVNILTRLQAVEYITSQNLDRRAFELFNAILVVPGAIGAWRKSVIEEVGGYSSETLAEDADLTVAIIRAGYRVSYEPNAIAMTEAPETFRQLLRQRLRWTLGIMQTGWKHKRAVTQWNGIGLVAIPNILIFGVLLSLFAPVADLIFIGSLLRLLRDFLHHPTMFPSLSSPTVFIAYGIYLVSDVILSFLAFILEPKEDKRLLFWVVFQRFFYRQLLYISTLISLGRAFTGQLIGWQKPTRTADVNLSTKRYSRSSSRDVGFSRADHRSE